MERGDISNEVAPRLVIVYENLLGLLPTKPLQAKSSTYYRLRRWKRLVNLFETNEGLAHRIWDVTWRLKFQVEVLTYLSEDAVPHIASRMTREDLPISRVWHMEPNKLAREIAHMPSVACIYDPDPSHVFTYGGRGRVISPAQPNLIGRF